jgi:hypothetical protein
MSIGIVFAAVVAITAVRFFRGKPFQPHLEIMVESRLVVIYEDACGYVHGVAQEETFPDRAFPQAFLQGSGDVYQLPPLFCLEP